MDKNECEDKYYEPETEEHLNGKRDLFEWIKMQKGVSNAVLEGWLPDTKQYPDILFEYNGKRHVIEYQCSPIATEYYERHELYKSAGIVDIWICGTEKYLGNNKRLNTLEQNARLYYDAKNKYLYKMCDITEADIKNIQKIISFRGNLNTYYRQRQYFNRAFHVMKNIYDYLSGYTNYLYIKSLSNSYYCTGSYYPSPTRRPSRKYPYPVKKYSYLKNYSYATCYKLFDVKLKNINGGN